MALCRLVQYGRTTGFVPTQYRNTQRGRVLGRPACTPSVRNDSNMFYSNFGRQHKQVRALVAFAAADKIAALGSRYSLADFTAASSARAASLSRHARGQYFGVRGPPWLFGVTSERSGRGDLTSQHNKKSKTLKAQAHTFAGNEEQRSETEGEKSEHGGGCLHSGGPTARRAGSRPARPGSQPTTARQNTCPQCEVIWLSDWREHVLVCAFLPPGPPPRAPGLRVSTTAHHRAGTARTAEGNGDDTSWEQSCLTV